MIHVEGIAYGPKGQQMNVTWGGIPAPSVGQEMAVVNASKRRLEASLHEAFPIIFGCDPERVEVHVKETK